MRPAMILSSVVFPHPDGPSRLVSCPCGNSSVMPLSASTPPSYTFATPRTCTMAGVLGRDCFSFCMELAFVSAEQCPFQPFDGLDEQHGEHDDEGNCRIHFWVFGDRLVIGDDVAYSCRRDQKLRQNDTDEACSTAEPQSGEYH